MLPDGQAVFVQGFSRGCSAGIRAGGSSSSGDRDGALQGQVGDWVWSAIPQRCRDELGVSAPLPHAWSEGAGLCHAGLSPCPGGFTGSKGALPAACAAVGPLGTHPAPGRSAAPLPVGHVGLSPARSHGKGRGSHPPRLEEKGGESSSAFLQNSLPSSTVPVGASKSSLYPSRGTQLHRWLRGWVSPCVGAPAGMCSQGREVHVISPARSMA